MLTFSHYNYKILKYIHMIKLMVTRFNNNTWCENTRWREKYNYEGCIYNAPIRIKNDISSQSIIYVIEMNNDTNKIIGIGRIQNRVHDDKKYKIYVDQNYNRYTYRGKKRIDNEKLKILEKKDIEKLEKLQTRIFTTKKHLKRGRGISQIPPDIEKEFLKFIDTIFTGAFT